MRLPEPPGWAFLARRVAPHLPEIPMWFLLAELVTVAAVLGFVAGPAYGMA